MTRPSCAASSLRLAGLFLQTLALLGSAGARGQSPEAPASAQELEVTQTQSLDAPAKAAGDDFLAQRLPVRTEDGLDFAVFRREKKTATLELPGGAAFALPSRLDVAVSEDAKTIVQYGDELIQMHPVRTNLYWIGAEGKVANQVQNRYNGQALVDLSPDGFLGVAGAGYFETHGQSAETPVVQRSGAELEVKIDLYSPEGKPIWSKGLEAGRTAIQLRTLPRGAGLLVQTASAKDRLQDHALQLLLRESAPRQIEGDFGILQKVVVVGDGLAVFVQGREAYGLASLESGRLLWQRPGNIRLISPYGAAMDPDGKLVLVMTGARSDRTRPEYDWTLTALAADSGESLAQLTLPKPYPSTWGQVFAEVTRQAAVVLAGDDRLEIPLAGLR